MTRSLETTVSTLVDALLRMYGFEGFAKAFKAEPTIDERLAKLSKIKEDLGEATRAVDELEQSALVAKREANQLEEEVNRLREDKEVAEKILKSPEDAFSRLLARAAAKGRGRGLLEGIVIGLLTGGISSWLVWYFTTKP
ncbi:hypothetical protein [Elongatibacter sediminis]|uniref:Uncharacterized protein n=1 Tax=Elongatibacter sediminis TaxID=3119006 RepID=A0AAW9RCV8_9GAMM